MTKDQKLALVKVEDVQVGTKLKADGGFICLCEGEIVTVQKCTDENAVEKDELFVWCAGGSLECLDGGPLDEPIVNLNADYGKPLTTNRDAQHFLVGQKDDEGENYVGFYKVLE